MGMSWKKPPPVVVIAGNEGYLRDREIRNAILITQKSGRQVVHAEADREVREALDLAATFGMASLILVGLSEISLELVQSIQKNPFPGTCVLLTSGKAPDEKKYPVLKEIHGAFQVSFMQPTKKKAVKDLAIRFVQSEASRWLQNKKALHKNLAEAIVKAVGTDLGVLAHEISKITALSRSEERDEVSVRDVKLLVRPASEADMEPLREGLRQRNLLKVGKALERIRRNGEPTMLLLRAKGGPADLALTWLRVSLLLGKGIGADEIAARISVPKWIVENDLIPSARRWGTPALRRLVGSLSDVDRGMLKGSPAPWVSCECALLLGCESASQ